MAAKILDGRQYSAEIRESIREKVQAMNEKYGVVPGLAVILVGNDPASEIYVRNKGNGCRETGMKSLTITLPEETTQLKLEETIDELNADDSIHGILVQLPLPRHLDSDRALARIRPEKDVDGFHLLNAGRLMTGLEGVIPCTPKGALYMLKKTGVELSGLNAVVVGRSNIVGKPMAMLLLQQNCTVTVCHSRTNNLKDITSKADILVCAVGKAGMIRADMVKDGAIVIDVGINRIEGKVVGDVDFASVSEKASWITPVPGGVGRMTIAMLLQNTLEAAEKAIGV